MINSIKIGTRSSNLAMYQANLVKEKLTEIFPNMFADLYNRNAPPDKQIRYGDRVKSVKRWSSQQSVAEKKVSLPDPYEEVKEVKQEKHTWFEAPLYVGRKHRPIYKLRPFAEPVFLELEHPGILIVK